MNTGGSLPKDELTDIRDGTEKIQRGTEVDPNLSGIRMGSKEDLRGFDMD